jgi:hypothetical protein
MSAGRTVLKIYAVGLGVAYVVVVAVLGVLKMTTDLCSSLAWSELLYGPAITVASIYLLIGLAYWLERWIRGRA